MANKKATKNRGRSRTDRTSLCFFALFLSVYFLESIGGFFMTSAIVSIEKQFQIPSKVSGLMVSAGDFGYIPAVVFVSYLGSKGNRARWIGGGCVLVAIANIFIGASNFVFPVVPVKLNTSTIERQLERDVRRLDAAGTGLLKESFLAELPAEPWAQSIRDRFSDDNKPTQYSPPLWLFEFLTNCSRQEHQSGRHRQSTRSGNADACRAFDRFLHKHNGANENEVENLRMLSSTSYAFCDRILSELRKMIEQLRCGRNISNLGPTAMIFFGLLILGVGRTMPFTLGLPLVDDNVRKNNLPLYLAGMFCIRIMGPLLGYTLGSYTNKYYYDWWKVPVGITPRDPMWIGRWWAGFLLIGGVLILPSLLLYFFPSPKLQTANKDAPDEDEEAEDNDKLLSDEARRESVVVVGEEKKKSPRALALFDRHLETDEDGNVPMPKNVSAMAVDFCRTISTVLRRPIFCWAMMGRIIDVLAFKGFHIFLPKYLQLQFGIPQHEVNKLLGIIGIPSFAVGVFAGSLAMRGLRLQGRKAASWVAIIGLIAACFSLLNATVGCKSTMTALGESLHQNAKNECLSGCQCEGASLYPVCDRNSSTVFFSPCQAGCLLTSNVSSFLQNPDSKQTTPTFYNCKCANGGDGQVSRKFCDEGNCRSRLYLYFTNMAVGGLIGGMGVVPGVLILLRSVPPKHRSISLGFNGFLVSLLATLPSPIIWGAIIDHFCVYWTKQCDSDGACALYATDNLRVWLHTIYGALRLVSFIADLFVIYHAKELRLTDSEGEKERDDDDDKNNNAILEKEQREEEKLFKLAENSHSPPQLPGLTFISHVHDISCAPPDYKKEEEEEGEERKKDVEKKEELKDSFRRLSLPPTPLATLPRDDVKPERGHRRAASRGDAATGASFLIRPSELEALSRSTSNFPFME